jgi:hypothetical protein
VRLTCTRQRVCVDLCDIDLGAAVMRKLRINHIKYPPRKARGSDKKYTELAGSQRFKRKEPLTLDEITSMEAECGGSDWWQRPIFDAAARASASLKGESVPSPSEEDKVDSSSVAIRSAVMGAVVAVVSMQVLRVWMQ